MVNTVKTVKIPTKRQNGSGNHYHYCTECGCESAPEDCYEEANECGGNDGHTCEQVDLYIGEE